MATPNKPNWNVGLCINLAPSEKMKYRVNYPIVHLQKHQPCHVEDFADLHDHNPYRGGAIAKLQSHSLCNGEAFVKKQSHS